MNNEELLEEGYTEVYVERIGKICRFLLHWNNGRWSGYPICCVFRFSVEGALQDGKTYHLETFRQRKPLIRGKGDVFIPCHVFHGSSSSKELEDHLKLYKSEE